MNTDFGNIYSKTPSRVFFPKTVKELSGILRDLSERNIPVIVCNTGHSVNGQTLTDGVQVSLGEMIWSRFDESLKEVTVGAGVSWDILFKEIRFPEYCVPVFPDNPGQEIHVTGTLAVGGIGNYSLNAGGVWNHVKRITLVTMEGEIITCSRTEHTDLFRYSLGGFGRIGVIAEATLEVIESPTTVLPITLVAGTIHSLVKKISALSSDPIFTGVIFGIGQSMLWSSRTFSFPSAAVLGLAENSDPETFFEHVRKKYGRTALFRHPFVRKSESRAILKHAVVYQTLRSFEKQNQGDGLCHPWSDYIIPVECAESFIRRMRQLLRKYNLIDYGIQEPIVGTPLEARFEVIGFLVKNVALHSEFNFPLSLDLPGCEMAVEIGCWPAVPHHRLGDAISFIHELTEYCYSLGGKRYLYGWHDLTQAQLLRQFGPDTILEWNKLRKKLDPKGLLNKNVIKNLD